MNSQFDIWNADAVQLREHIRTLNSRNSELTAALETIVADVNNGTIRSVRWQSIAKARETLAKKS